MGKYIICFTIVLVNLPSIYIATKYYYHSIYLISTIIFNLIFYLSIYYSLFKIFRSKNSLNISVNIKNPSFNSLNFFFTPNSFFFKRWYTSIAHI